MRLLPLAQGAFFIAGGLWPVVHLRSFERVTGPKRDDWLVKTMGGVLAAIGASLIASAFGPPTRAERLLGLGSAAALGAADFLYGGTGRISRIYLADGVAQGGLVLGWLGVRAPESRRHASGTSNRHA